MQLGVSCHIKYQFSPTYKAIYNNTIPNFILVMITGLEVLNNFENEKLTLGLTQSHGIE